jgi:hypothetical protein
VCDECQRDGPNRKSAEWRLHLDSEGLRGFSEAEQIETNLAYPLENRGIQFLIHLALDR